MITSSVEIGTPALQLSGSLQLPKVPLGPIQLFCATPIPAVATIKTTKTDTRDTHLASMGSSPCDLIFLGSENSPDHGRVEAETLAPQPARKVTTASNFPV